MAGVDSDEVPKTSQKLRSLHHAATDILAAKTVEEVFETTVETADSVLDFDGCGVFVTDGDKFRLAATTRLEEKADLYYDIDEGVVGRTHRENEAFLVEEAADHPDAKPISDIYQSGLSVPVGDEAVFQAISTTEAYYDDTDLELAELLVVHVEAALDRVRSEQDVKTQKQKIKRLHSVAVDLESCMTHEELFEAMIDAAEDILGFDWCGLFTPGDEYFITTAISDDAPSEVGDRTLPLYEGHTGRAYKTGESLISENSVESDAAEPVSEEIRSGLTVPVGDFAVFSAVDSRTDAFDEADLELAELLAANVAEAHERIKVQTELRERQRELDLLKQVQARVLRHNIRNDLTVIAGVAKRIPEVDQEREPELVDHILKTADELGETSEKVRQVKHVIDHSEHRSTFDLASLVETVLRDAGETFPAADFAASVPSSVSVSAHRDLPVAIENVVENAVVHNDDDPAVRVTVERSDGVAVCHVEDDGPGIPEPETAVLERQGETALEHCSGVGLWLVKAVVERSDGTLSFDADDDGTRVTLRLPLDG